MTSDSEPIKIACDACVGGLARWLRLLGVDTTYTHGIDDGDLVQHAIVENRIVISADGPLFDRRAFTREGLRGIRLPVGLSISKQLEVVIKELHIKPSIPRCTHCNGRLKEVKREEVADRVPPRTLKWLNDYFVCEDCDHLFWEGTHWNRIHKIRDKIAQMP